MEHENYDLIKALQTLTPGAEWVIRGDEVYSNLEWSDTEQEKPTEEEVVQKQAELKYQYEIKVYHRQRAREYPSYADQFDKIFHEGIDAWKADIQAIKDRYPKQTMDADILQTRKDKAIFDLQTERYLKATERLSQYILLEGREEIREDVVVETKEVVNEETGEIETVNVTEEVITQTAIEPLEEFVEVTTTDPETMESTTETVRNPLIVKDEEERAAAQAVVDATPQAVIDAVNA